MGLSDGVFATIKDCTHFVLFALVLLKVFACLATSAQLVKLVIWYDTPAELEWVWTQLVFYLWLHFNIATCLNLG